MALKPDIFFAIQSVFSVNKVTNQESINFNQSSISRLYIYNLLICDLIRKKKVVKCYVMLLPLLIYYIDSFSLYLNRFIPYYEICLLESQLQATLHYLLLYLFGKGCESFTSELVGFIKTVPVPVHHDENYYLTEFCHYFHLE